jgi:hypothetical protein
MAETERGDTFIDRWEKIGELVGVLAQERPESRMRWNQQGFPVSHRIIAEGGNNLEILPGDSFEHEGRRFFVTEIPYDPGELGHWTIYYCQERRDV